MALYAKVVNEEVVKYKEYQTLDMSTVRHVDGKPMLRPVVDVDPPFNSKNHVRSGPVVIIQPTEIQRVWTVRDKTPAELKKDKEQTVDRQEPVLMAVLLEQENRIRALENKPPQTMVQFKKTISDLI